MTKICEVKNCDKTALFGITEKQFCFSHKTNEMTNLKKRKCVVIGCSIQPYYNLPGFTFGVRCLKHKTDKMINVVTKKCDYENCKITPSYGLPNGRMIRCIAHKTKDMVNLKNNVCESSGCRTQPSFNYENLEPKFCGKHKKENMVNIRYLRQKQSREKKKKEKEIVVQEDLETECYGNSKNLCEDDNCEKCFNLSFASHPKSKFWHKDNEKTPRQVSKGSSVKFKFLCENCEHSFESILSNLIKEEGTRWCPYCSVPVKKLCDNKNCLHCFNNSFASHPKVRYWHKDNEEDPRNVIKNSGKSFKFWCDCGHTFIKETHNVKNRWCPYCCNPPQLLCKEEDCEHCFNNSFASYTRAEFWDYDKNEEIPRNVFKGTRYKYYFICEKKHSFLIAPNNITCINNWCGFCVNKTEGKLYKWLQKNYENVKHQVSFDWCKNEETGRKYRFDFYLQDHDLIIELDGDQHFRQISNWKCPTKTKESDLFKMNKANENGLSVLRVYQLDVFYDEYDWETRLIKAIKKREIVKNKFIGSNKVYKNFCGKID